MGEFAPERKRVWGGLSALSLLTAACIGPAELQEVLLWEGILEPVPGASTSVAGSMAMVAGAQTTQVGVGIEEAEPGSTLGWAVRAGSCESPGTRIAPPESFQPVMVGEMGNGERNVWLGFRLMRAQGYAGQVTAEPDGSGEILACADLLERDGSPDRVTPFHEVNAPWGGVAARPGKGGWP